MTGLPKSIIAKYGITKKAWSVFRGRSRSKPKTRTVTKKRRMGGLRMARRRRHHYSRGFTLPIAPIAGLAAGIADPIFTSIGGNPKWGIQKLIENYTGVKTGGENFEFLGWDPMAMTKGLVPLAVGLMVHKFIGGKPLNANQMLARAGVPIVRI